MPKFPQKVASPLSIFPPLPAPSQHDAPAGRFSGAGQQGFFVLRACLGNQGEQSRCSPGASSQKLLTSRDGPVPGWSVEAKTFPQGVLVGDRGRGHRGTDHHGEKSGRKHVEGKVNKPQSPSAADKLCTRKQAEQMRVLLLNTVSLPAWPWPWPWLLLLSHSTFSPGA